MNFCHGMQRLAIFAGVLGAAAGGVHAHKDLRNVPSERYQHKVFERLAASEYAKQALAPLISARAKGYTLGSGVSISPTEQKPGMPPIDTDGIKTIYLKPDLSIDYFEMQDGGYVNSEPSPSVWLYLLWVTYPALGFLIVWLIVRAIGWVVIGFLPNLN